MRFQPPPVWQIHRTGRDVVDCGVAGVDIGEWVRIPRLKAFRKLNPSPLILHRVGRRIGEGKRKRVDRTGEPEPGCGRWLGFGWLRRDLIRLAGLGAATTERAAGRGVGAAAPTRGPLRRAARLAGSNAGVGR